MTGKSAAVLLSKEGSITIRRTEGGVYHVTCLSYHAPGESSVSVAFAFDVFPDELHDFVKAVAMMQDTL